MNSNPCHRIGWSRGLYWRLGWVSLAHHPMRSWRQIVSASRSVYQFPVRIDAVGMHPRLITRSACGTWETRAVDVFIYRGRIVAVVRCRLSRVSVGCPTLRRCWPTRLGRVSRASATSLDQVGGAPCPSNSPLVRQSNAKSPSAPAHIEGSAPPTAGTPQAGCSSRL